MLQFLEEPSFFDRACIECNVFIYQISVFIKKVQVFSAKCEITKNDEAESDELFEEISASSQHSNDETENEKYHARPEVTTTRRTQSTSLLQRSERDEDEKYFTLQCHVNGCEAPEFKRMSQLVSHTRKEHSCPPKVKCYCDKVLSTVRVLFRHRNKHFPSDADFRCSGCRQTFRTKKGLDNHFEKCHGPDKQSFLCSQCGRSFSEQKVLDRHQITHDLPPQLRRNHKCSECDKTFISADGRNQHHAKYHAQVELFFCDVCSKGFYNRRSLQSHQDTHLLRSVPCDLCSKTYKSRSNMQKHRKTHFLLAQSSLLVCDICHKQFRSKNQLTQHMFVHNDVAAFSCQVCLKSFKKKVYLNSHMGKTRLLAELA